MCLSNVKEIKLDFDKTVYKVLRKEIDEDGRVTYHSPYIDIMSWEETVRNSVQNEVRLKGSEISEGAYHSFMLLHAAMSEAELLNELTTKITKCSDDLLFNTFPLVSYVVGEFIIPKDSKYVYEGEYVGVGTANTGYASSDLIFKKAL